MSKRIDEINDRYLEIWEEYHKSDNQEIKNLLAIVPMQYSDFQDLSKGVLYIGLNPSFSIKGIRGIYKKAFNENYDDKTIIDLFRWRDKNYYKDEQLSRIIKFESAAKQYYPFFEPMRRFAKENNNNWAHIDVFPMRKTSAIALNDEFEKLPKLKDDLLDIFYALLKAIFTEKHPQITVVVNADATLILRQQWGTNIGILDHNYCYYPLTYQNNKTRLLFVGLTGHGLDRYSKERLFWIMKRIINDETS